MIVSLPLFGIHGETTSNELNSIDYIALLCWCIGFLFESVGDYQLTKFKKNPANKGAQFLKLVCGAIQGTPIILVMPQFGSLLDYFL